MIMEKNITCKIIKTLAVLRENNGYTKELRVVSWNDGTPKLDLHEWTPEGRCCKGVTLTDDEGRALLQGLTEYFAEVDADDEG